MFVSSRFGAIRNGATTVVILKGWQANIWPEAFWKEMKYIILKVRGALWALASSWRPLRSHIDRWASNAHAHTLNRWVQCDVQRIRWGKTWRYTPPSFVEFRLSSWTTHLDNQMSRYSILVVVVGIAYSSRLMVNLTFQHQITWFGVFYRVFFFTGTPLKS